jgi:hypothetical protein
MLLVPLTTDYDHLQAKLADLNGTYPPADVRPTEESKSGTRIGAALAAAVEAHDPRFPGYQDIVLLTDGDDPANDREWAAGVSAARKANIPVHVVGIGRADEESPIILDGKPLEYELRPGIHDWARTRLHEEDVAKAIAGEGRGEYLAAQRDLPKLGEFFRGRIEPYPSRVLTDDALPQPKDRSAWFLGIGLACLLLAWVRER